jgi:hypothetical protein
MKASAAALARIAAWRAANRSRVLEHKRRYYQRHKAAHARWKKANPNKVKASYARHAAHHRARIKAWQLANPERFRASKRRYDAAQAEQITTTYVRKLIARHDGAALAAQLPPAFIEAKKSHLQLKRLYQDLQTSRN